MKYLCCLCVFFLTLHLKAQLKEKFEKGCIVKDSLKSIGYVKLDDLSGLSSGVCFKSSLAEKKCKLYDMTQITSYEIGNGNTFDLLVCKMSNNRKEIKLFANLIFKGGELSLYKSIYNSKIIYMLSKSGMNYVLQNDKLISGEMEIRKYDYEGVLNFATEGVAFRNAKKMKFEEDYFIEIVSEYKLSKERMVRT